MSLPAWMSRMNAACFAASLDFEDSLVALSSANSINQQKPGSESFISNVFPTNFEVAQLKAKDVCAMANQHPFAEVSV